MPNRRSISLPALADISAYALRNFPFGFGDALHMRSPQTNPERPRSPRRLMTVK
jgi:hypothetical protein